MTRGQAQAGSPSLDERLVKELANLAFVAEATNILLRGPPGVGKTHLAVALALKAIESGQGVYFVRAYDWKPPGVSPETQAELAWMQEALKATQNQLQQLQHSGRPASNVEVR